MTDRSTHVRPVAPAQDAPMTELVAAAVAASAAAASVGQPAPGSDPAAALVRAADARTRDLVDGFIHQAGPPPGRFAWVALGSHARGELHCGSDQDHALIWDAARAAGSSYAKDLAGEVIAGLAAFGMRPCDGGYMADRWSVALVDWVAQARDRIEAPTPQAVLDTDVFLDLRRLAGDLDITPATEVLLAGSGSPRLLHGLAAAATSFPTALGTFGRMPHGPVDLKRTGLAPLVLLARLYGLDARSPAVGTRDRLEAAAAAGVLSEELVGRLAEGFEVLTRLRLAAQVEQVRAGLPLSDKVVINDLEAEDRIALREAFRAIRAAQSVTAMTFRTDL
jgi:CBS domain-containing protein